MHRKRGYKNLNPSAKKAIRRCCLCGRVGFASSILEDDYDVIKDQKTVDRHQKLTKLIQKIDKNALQAKYEPLSLDRFGRCEVCAGIADNDKPVA